MSRARPGRSVGDLPRTPGLVTVPFMGRDARGGRYVVREAGRRDATRHIELTRDLVAETPFMLKGPRDVLPEAGEHRVYLEHLARLPNCLCLLAVRPGLAPGLGIAVGTLTLLGGQSYRTRHTAQLSMGVRASAWGVGIGGALLDAGLTWARARPILARVGLQVYASNAAARQLYVSRGFTEEGWLAREVDMEGVWEDLVGMSVDVRAP